MNPYQMGNPGMPEMDTTTEDARRRQERHRLAMSMLGTPQGGGAQGGGAMSAMAPIMQALIQQRYQGQQAAPNFAQQVNALPPPQW